jgi:hypothetical protein
MHTNIPLLLSKGKLPFIMTKLYDHLEDDDDVKVIGPPIG